MRKIYIASALLTMGLWADGGLLSSGSQVEVAVYPHDGTQQYTATLKAGTLGAGIDISHRYNDKLGFRLNINGLKFNETKEVANLDYDADISLFTAGVLADYFPVAQSSFRLSAGLYYNDNHGDGVFNPSTTFYLGSHEYTVTDVVKVHAGAYFESSAAPYLGLGWEKKNILDGVGFTLDIGALYQGSTKVYANAEVADGISTTTKQQIEEDVETERAQIESDLEDYTWYPVIMIGVNYSF